MMPQLVGSAFAGDSDEDDDVEEDEGFEDDLLDCVNVDENIINPPLETDATKSGKR